MERKRAARHLQRANELLFGTSSDRGFGFQTGLCLGDPRQCFKELTRKVGFDVVVILLGDYRIHRDGLTALQRYYDSQRIALSIVTRLREIATTHHIKSVVLAHDIPRQHRDPRLFDDSGELPYITKHMRLKLMSEEEGRNVFVTDSPKGFRRGYSVPKGDIALLVKTEMFGDPKDPSALGIQQRLDYLFDRVELVAGFPQDGLRVRTLMQYPRPDETCLRMLPEVLAQSSIDLMSTGTNFNWTLIYISGEHRPLLQLENVLDLLLSKELGIKLIVIIWEHENGFLHDSAWRTKPIKHIKALPFIEVEWLITSCHMPVFLLSEVAQDYCESYEQPYIPLLTESFTNLNCFDGDLSEQHAQKTANMQERHRHVVSLINTDLQGADIIGAFYSYCTPPTLLDEYMQRRKFLYMRQYADRVSNIFALPVETAPHTPIVQAYRPPPGPPLGPPLGPPPGPPPGAPLGLPLAPPLAPPLGPPPRRIKTT